MNRETITKKINYSLINQINHKGFITPVDTLMDIGVLSDENYKKWRFGQIDYLERVCTCNLSQLAFIMKLIRSFSIKQRLKPFITIYKSWGKEKKLLRFSKSQDRTIEKHYSTHYINNHEKGGKLYE